MKNITFSTKYLKYTISADAENIGFSSYVGDERIISGPCAVITADDRSVIPAVKASYDGGLLSLVFADGTEADIDVSENDEYLTFTMSRLSREDFLSISFVNITLNDASSDFVGTLMGMTLSTNMREHPGDNRELCASAFPHIGVFSTKSSKYPAKAAVIGAPPSEIRRIERTVLDEIPDGEVPKSKIGGPYADMCAEAAQGTYAIHIGSVTMGNVDKIISAMRRFGITQINLHHYGNYAQGDFHCLENAHPNGFSDFKKVIDRLHDEGMLVGLQTYSFFLVNYSTYITPVPHRDLDTLMEFTSAEDMDESCGTLKVNESTDGLSAEDTYICVNSPYLWIDDEIVKFTSSDGNTVHIEERGAYGTVPAAHKKGSRVRQLKQYFRIPCAKAGSELFYEIARNTAEFCNRCGADMFYLDALDGSFILDGEDYVWYHAMDFLREMCNHLDHDLIFDCCYNPQYTGSWFVRSRYGAIDTPQNSHRRCVDAHVNYNMITAKRMGVTPELGWIDLFTKGSKPENRWQNDTVYPEDLEYHCAKAFATEASLAFLYNFNVHEDMPCAVEYAQILNKYAEYRKKTSPSEAAVQWLSQPDNAAFLDDSGLYRQKHYVHTFEHPDSVMEFTSPFGDCTPAIRIEPLNSAGSYDDPDAVTLCSIDETVPLTTARIDFETPINSNGNRGIGVWCHGDGTDTLVCVNLRNFAGNKQKSSEHFIRTNFKGWRYFAFYEHQNGTLPTELWERKELEYSNYNELQKFYGYYRVNFDYETIDAVDITVKGSGQVYMKDIRFVPHIGIPMTNPTVRIGDTEVTFETELHQDHNLYFDGSVCRVTDAIGNTIALPKWHGQLRTSKGDNTAAITSESDQYTRAKLTLTVTGTKLQ